jgi:hypothetical protein
LVNGLFTSEDSTLHEGDIVSIFPPLIGGTAISVSAVSKGEPIPLLRANLQG